ncbi:MAG: hypothetical protein QCI82_05205 [Candidatus Thermoplasmatota archaeon]|nr:hypothetical protein [Candidatus Thermoplasmatota archaeon]
MPENENELSERMTSDLLYLEQMDMYCKNTMNTPEYIRATAMYTQALHVLEQRYSGMEPLVYSLK